MPRTLHQGWDDEAVTESAHVVYDPATGEVRHVHREIVLPGGRATPPARLAQRALHMAKTAGPAGSGGKAKLAVLQVKPSLLRPGEGIRVDKGRLVRSKAIPAGARQAKARGAGRRR